MFHKTAAICSKGETCVLVLYKHNLLPFSSDSSFVKYIVLFLLLLIASPFEFSFDAESLVLCFIIRGQK